MCTGEIDLGCVFAFFLIFFGRVCGLRKKKRERGEKRGRNFNVTTGKEGGDS